MKSRNVRSEVTVAFFNDLELDEQIVKQIVRQLVQQHQSPDLLWLAANPDVAMRARDATAEEVRLLGLQPGARVSIAARAAGVAFTYFDGEIADSEVAVIVVQHYLDLSHLST
jgi:hypothetical protein